MNDPLEIPPHLRRGHPHCWVKGEPRTLVPAEREGHTAAPPPRYLTKAAKRTVEAVVLAAIGSKPHGFRWLRTRLTSYPPKVLRAAVRRLCRTTDERPPRLRRVGRRYERIDR